jgi:hypothetical protein
MPKQKKTSDTKLDKFLEKKLAKSLADLHEAAVTFGAVSHPDYMDDRQAKLVKRHQARLETASKKYHEVVMMAGFLLAKT